MAKGRKEGKDPQRTLNRELVGGRRRGRRQQAHIVPPIIWWIWATPEKRRRLNIWGRYQFECEFGVQICVMWRSRVERVKHASFDSSVGTTSKVTTEFGRSRSFESARNGYESWHLKLSKTSLKNIIIRRPKQFVWIIFVHCFGRKKNTCIRFTIYSATPKLSVARHELTKSLWSDL